MRLYIKPLIFFMLVLIILPVLAGCTSTPILKSSDIPILETGSPLSRIKQKYFLIKEFRDTRGLDPKLVAKLGFTEHKIDKPVATVVANAIQNELLRNGHKCVKDEFNSKPDFIIEGSVYKYGFRIDKGFYSSTIIAETAVKLSISSSSNVAEIFINNYEGEIHDIPGWPTWLDYISTAQLSMLKSFSTDLKLTEFIEIY